MWYSLVIVLDQGFSSYAVVASLVVVGSAALLGAGVWSLSGRYPGAAPSRVRFVIRHLAFACIYATLLMSLEIVLFAFRLNATIIGAIRKNALGMLQGVVLFSWLYGLVAAFSYAVRAHRHLRDQQVVAARAETAAAQAQLRALRAQLHPHFLFNALHSLSVLVRCDPVGAERSIEHLGDMLRYALSDNVKEDVPLADEWAFVEHYLALEALRLGPRLRLQVDLEPDAMDVPVPFFILQPLVENAIRHGIAPRAAGGTLDIRAQVAGDDLVIRVSDDGPGADAAATRGAASGLGLKTLRRRLDARYGGRATFAIETAPGAGFTVTLKLPQQDVHTA